MRPAVPCVNPAMFIACPAFVFGGTDPAQWALVQELYRIAWERTQAELTPAPTDRLAAYWN